MGWGGAVRPGQALRGYSVDRGFKRDNKDQLEGGLLFVTSIGRWLPAPTVPLAGALTGRGSKGLPHTELSDPNHSPFYRSED